MWLSVCEALKRFLSFIFLGAGRNALFLAISMWRFLLLKDSSSPGERIPPSRRRVGRILFFPAPGLAPGAGSPSRRRLSSRRRLKPSSFPSAGWKLSSLAGRKTSNRGDILTTVAGLHPHPVAAWLLNIPIRCHRWFVRSPFSYLFPLIITMLFPLDPSVTTYHLLDGTMDCFPMMIDDN